MVVISLISSSGSCLLSSLTDIGFSAHFEGLDEAQNSSGHRLGNLQKNGNDDSISCEIALSFPFVSQTRVSIDKKKNDSS